MDFLQDHWPYNEEELVRLLDLCFAWKAEGSREVLFIAGDIHCGVTSVVRDEETGLQINQAIMSCSLMHDETTTITTQQIKYTHSIHLE